MSHAPIDLDSPPRAAAMDRTLTDGSVVEWAPFQLADGVSEAALFEASDALQRDFLERQPGFVRRDLLRGADGAWCDLVIWRDERSAMDAMKVAESSATCLRYFSLLTGPDGASPGAGVQLLHLARSY